MMLRMRAPVVGALAAALLTFAVACGDDDAESNDVRDTTTTTSEATAGTTASEFESYVGLTVDEAGAEADDDGRPWRIVEEDGEPLPVTLDHNPERLNFVVVDGRVTQVTTG